VAIQEIPDRETENKKRTLYLLGQFGFCTSRTSRPPKKHLTALAAMDFTYKDISKLLDKLAQLREILDSAVPRNRKNRTRRKRTTNPRAMTIRGNPPANA